VAERRAERDAETFAQLAEIYMRKWAKQVGADGRPRKRSREDERQINLYLLPAWRNHKVKDITRRDVRDLVEGIAERRLRKGTTEDGLEKVGAPIMANRVLSLVKKMFNFALDREWIDANPAARLKTVSPETARDRVLSADGDSDLLARAGFGAPSNRHPVSDAAAQGPALRRGIENAMAATGAGTLRAQN
jgi:site-specific recombinase XerD